MNTNSKLVRLNVPLLSIIGVLMVVFIIFSVISRSFLTISNFLNISQQLAPNLIVAVALTYVITTGGIDLSVGSILALIGSLTAICLNNQLNGIFTLALMMAIGALIGAINGGVTAYYKIPPLIVTLASMTFVQGIALLITGGYSIAIPQSSWILEMGQGTLFGVPTPAVIAFFVLVFSFVVFRNTRFGIYVTGIGANEEGVRRSGVATRRVKLTTYILSGLAAAVAGMIIAARLGSGSSDVGTNFALQVIAAVVLGGTDLFGGSGTIVGSLVGVILLGFVNNGLILLHVSPYYSPIVEGLILLIAVILNTRIMDWKPKMNNKVRKKIVNG